MLERPEAEIEAAQIRMREDRCSLLDTQLQWLRDTGFSDVDCWFKDGQFAVDSGSGRHFLSPEKEGGI